MRQLLVQVPRGHGARVITQARAHGGLNLTRIDSHGEHGPEDLVLVHVPNRALGDLLDALEDVPRLRVSFAPQGVLALHPPSEEAPEQVTHVEERSPVEVFLGGLQSVGTWRGMLGYAAAAGAVVWIGLITNAVYLLVAAMLIAPFAGPAMNAALATARGDFSLLGQSLARYVASLAVTAAIAGSLTLAIGQRVATSLMVDITSISSVALLLPLAAGAAGALHLVQSDRNSLVSGAAVGILVAASLAPPAGILGMALVLQRPDMALASLFLLLLQLAGINASGALVFYAYGLRSRGPRYARGAPRTRHASLALTLLLLAALLAWQLHDEPALQRSTLAQRAAADVQQAVQESGLASLVEADVRFTRAEIQGQNTLLVVAYVQKAAHATLPDDVVRERLQDAIQERLARGDYGATPLVTVHVLAPPPRT